MGCDEGDVCGEVGVVGLGGGGFGRGEIDELDVAWGAAGEGEEGACG